MISFSWELTAAAADDGNTDGRDLSLDVLDGDLLVVEGDLVLDTGIAAIASDLKSRLQTFAQEYFLDTTIGVPWLQGNDQFPAILGGKPSIPRSSEILRGVILETPGVTGLLVFAVSVIGRVLNLRFRCTTNTDQVITAALALEAGGN